MEKNMEYYISAGEFAKLCNTTRDTLRYYHKQGILVPFKDERNGYHYYSYAQMASFYFIMIFRRLGCSVADIKSYLLGGEEVRFDAFLDKQYEALLEERRELDRKIAMVAGTRKLLMEIRKADTGGPALCILPEMMRLKVTEVKSFPATSAGEIQSDIRRHLIESDVPGVQIFPVGAVIDKEDFMEGNYAYKQVFSFMEAGADIELSQNYVNLAGHRAAVCVCRDKDGDIKKAYQALTDFLKENDFIPLSDVYSLSIVNVIDPHEMRRYLKYLFITVQS